MYLCMHTGNRQRAQPASAKQRAYFYMHAGYRKRAQPANAKREAAEEGSKSGAGMSKGGGGDGGGSGRDAGAVEGAQAQDAALVWTSWCGAQALLGCLHVFVRFRRILLMLCFTCVNVTACLPANAAPGGRGHCA